MARKILGGCYGSDSGRATSQYSRSYPAALPYYSAYYWLALRRESLCNKLCTAKDLAEQGKRTEPDSLQNAAESRVCPQGSSEANPGRGR